MILKAPGFFTVLASSALAAAVVYAKLVGPVPLLAHEPAQFYGLLAAYAVLLLGCTMRGL